MQDAEAAAMAVRVISDRAEELTALEETAAAIRAVADRKTTGKVVIEVSS